MIRAEFSKFLIVGTTTVLIDFLIYRLFLYAVMENVALAKATGFIAGTLFAYFANRFWTFGQQLHASKSAWRFGVLYASTLIINTSGNSFLLSFMNDGNFSVISAFLLATGISAILNFFGMKYFVFTSRVISGSL